VSLAQCRPHGAELGSCSECREQRRGFFEALLLEMRNAPSTGGSALPDMTRDSRLWLLDIVVVL